jgi:hypothetical protein
MTLVSQAVPISMDQLDLFSFYAIFVWISNIIFCGQLAGLKNQSIVAWCFLGAILPGIALIAIAGVAVEPYSPKKVLAKENEEGYKPTASMQGDVD